MTKPIDASLPCEDRQGAPHILCGCSGGPKESLPHCEYCCQDLIFETMSNSDQKEWSEMRVGQEGA